MQKLGMYTGISYPRTLEERLELIKAAGFDVVCLNFEEDMRWSETDWENQVKLAQKYRLPVQAVHLTGTKMTGIWTDGEVAEYVTDRLIRELEGMSQVGVPIGVAHITWGFDKPPAPSESALRRFERIAAAAEKYNVKLALENSVFAEHVHYILSHIPSDHVGFCYDSGHENAFTPTEDYLSVYPERLLTMHLHDNIGSYDNHFVPFDPRGTIDWEKKALQLKRTKAGSEYIIIEVGRQDVTMEELITQSYNAAYKLAELSDAT